MNIKPFQVEEWMNAYEAEAKYNIAETWVDSISLNDLFALTGVNKSLFLDEFCRRRMTYGDIEGALSFRQGVSRLYKSMPTYQQLYSIPESLGAKVLCFI